MKKKTSKGPRITRVAFLLLWAAVAVVAVQQWSAPVGAQEQGGTIKSPGQPAITSQPWQAPQPKSLIRDFSAPAKAPDLENSACFDCHTADILKLSKEELAEQVVVEGEATPPKPRPLFVAGAPSLAIKQKEYAEGIHGETTCVTCHKDVAELPHKQRLAPVDCKECHEEAVEAVKVSAHGEKAGAKAPGCVGCHDPHYTKAAATYAKDFETKLCLDCHKAYGMDTHKAHSHLYEYRIHLKMPCAACHEGAKKGVHNIVSPKVYVAHCESCHNKYTILSKEKKLPTRDLSYSTKAGFINADALKKYGYMVGAHRIPLLDLILILAVVAPLGLPVFHGGLRILTRRKEPVQLPEEKILLHPLIERIWHWFQALCIVMLIITGVMLHWPEKFQGWFQWAINVHNWFGIGAVVAFIVWLAYNLVTGRIWHYIPKKEEIPGGIIKQARFYGYGIFKHEPHPYAPSEDNKFNPLQKIAYLKFQVLLLPLLLISGVIYMYPDSFKGLIDAMGGMAVLGTIHLILGALFAAFLVAHLYLATTGETVAENFKAIITGYGIKSDHGDHGDHGDHDDHSHKA